MTGTIENDQETVGFDVVVKGVGKAELGEDLGGEVDGFQGAPFRQQSNRTYVLC